MDPSRVGVTLADARALVAYLDSSALIKLIVVEAESLRASPRTRPVAAAHVEPGRAHRGDPGGDSPRSQRPRRSPHEFSQTWTCSQVDPIAPDASRLGGMLLRCLDAIHLATAASIAPELSAVITGDRRMIAEGHALGLAVLTPA